MKKFAPFLFGLLLCSFHLRSQGTSWANNITFDTPTNCGTGCYHFQLSNVPSHPDGYKVYWFFDDGTEKSGSLNVFQTDHTFIKVGTRSVYAEVTKLYDKDDKPARIGPVNVTIGSGDAGTEPIYVSSALSVGSNRKPRGGDLITYTFTYGEACDEILPDSLVIIYDPNQLGDPGGLGFAKHAEFYPENYAESSAQSNNPDTIVFTNLNPATDGLAKRVFLTFLVDDTVEADDPVELDVELSYPGEGEACNTTVDATQRAVNSHDPNYIVSDRKEICGAIEPGDSVVYTIHFQNIGAGMAEEVKVRTYLPYFYVNNTFQIQTLYPANTPHSYNNVSRELVWMVSKGNGQLRGGAGLRGTAESDYRVAFPEEHTRDSIQFKVYFADDPNLLEPCRTIAMQASIVFDCNPSISTNFHYIDVVCQDTMAVDSCKCTVLPDTTIVQQIFNSQKAPTILDVSNYGGSVLWYPGQYLSPNAINSQVTASPPRSLEYVASIRGANCDHRLVHYQVKVECDLDISTKVKLKGCGPFGGGNVQSGRIEATAVTTGDPNNLIWNYECRSDLNGQKSGKTYCLDNLTPGNIYHLTVKDVVTGCWAEKTVYIPTSCPTGFPWKTAGLALLALAVLALVARLFRRP